MTEIKLEDLMKIFEGADVAELENVTINGNVEIEATSGGGDAAGIQLAIGQGAAQVGMGVLQLAQMLGIKKG